MPGRGVQIWALAAAGCTGLAIGWLLGRRTRRRNYKSQPQARGSHEPGARRARAPKAAAFATRAAPPPPPEAAGAAPAPARPHPQPPYAGGLVVGDRPLVTLDLETTGLRVARDRIIEARGGRMHARCWHTDLRLP